MDNSFYKKYIVAPFFLLIKNWSIFLLFLIFLVVNYIYSKYSNINLVINAKSVYNNLPSAVLLLFKNKLTAIIIIICFFLTSYLIVAVGKDMYMIFTFQRKSLSDSIKHISLKSFFWFLKLEVYIYFIFGIIAIFFYGFTFVLWKITRAELMPIIVLGVAFLLLYPLFYIGLSLGSMLSVLPMDSAKKFNKIKYFLHFKPLFATYLFYTARLFIEYLLIFGLPFLSIYFFKNLIFADAFTILGLVIPLLLLRSSAYEFKLNILRNDSDIETIFRKHFDSTNAVKNG